LHFVRRTPPSARVPLDPLLTVARKSAPGSGDHGVRRIADLTTDGLFGEILIRDGQVSTVVRLATYCDDVYHLRKDPEDQS
jgi:hypothetical protein